MIQPNELRIGNYISHKSINLFRVDSIKLYTAVMFPFLPESTDSTIELSFSDAEPIPLTDEILLKCGFVEDKHGSYTSDYIEVYFSNGESFGVMGGIPIPNIKSLHQLQNMFFVLTGKELKVKL